MPEPSPIELVFKKLPRSIMDEVRAAVSASKANADGEYANATHFFIRALRNELDRRKNS